MEGGASTRRYRSCTGGASTRRYRSPLPFPGSSRDQAFLSPVLPQIQTKLIQTRKLMELEAKKWGK